MRLALNISFFMSFRGIISSAFSSKDILHVSLSFLKDRSLTATMMGSVRLTAEAASGGKSMGAMSWAMDGEIVKRAFSLAFFVV
jgi:hypothetical protein